VALARRGHVRRCWGDVGDVMAQQGDEGEREEQWPEVGGPGGSPPCFPGLTAWVGAREAGDRQRRGRALLGGQGLGLGLPTTVANSCFHFV
jgi:hypothetical protein